MSQYLPHYFLKKEIEDSLDYGVKRLEYVLDTDSTSTGILVYVFYFQKSTFCTGIRLVFYDEDKYKKTFNDFSKTLVRINANHWKDSKNNVLLSTFIFSNDKLTYYFLDIENLK